MDISTDSGYCNILCGYHIIHIYGYSISIKIKLKFNLCFIKLNLIKIKN